MSQTSEELHIAAIHKNTGWKNGSIYQSEDGTHFSIDMVYATSLQAWAIDPKTGNLLNIEQGECYFDLEGNRICEFNCKHGDLVKLVDQNTTTYKIKGNG